MLNSEEKVKVMDILDQHHHQTMMMLQLMLHTLEILVMAAEMEEKRNNSC
jgi:hypothetical protein